ncbi:class F sortase [Solwaraspora sp. WMMD792]|uniref:class F sortase n=1 Tax=Solwaraspora sp. WMMD792 TaxID=3016099 RepID=UPI0024180FFE|nr:class F sortase [Solwaraspora sp. WMMD792]MDG4772560.1 class F sortase [Solwaraspora sp. WMMD792]
MVRPTPAGGRPGGWVLPFLTQVTAAGTTAHTVAPRVSTYGQPRPTPPDRPTDEVGDPPANGATDQPTDGAAYPAYPAIPGTARGVARAPLRGVAAVPGAAGRRGVNGPAANRRAPHGPPRQRRSWPGFGSLRPGRRRAEAAAAQRVAVGGYRGRTDAPSRWSPVALVLIVAGVFVAGFGFERVTGTPLGQWLPGAHRATPETHPPLGASDPVSLAIPALNLQAAVHDVGLAEDGTIAVPELNRHNEAGWYVASPTPGENGPAVIVGHVDTSTGPSVFHRAATLHPGAQIQVRRMDRSVALFEVTSVEQFDKSSLPVDRVYDDFSHPGLRLITCGGQWVGGSTGYADNVVVFASLVGAQHG